ncbi:MAG: TIGR04282 family arsenosugar biosynthesis glycosyltransferase [Saprospiraceae bacterium]
MMHSNALLIFIKNPELGKVKTRLAAGLGDEKALQIYLQLQEMTRNLALQLDCKRYLFYSDSIDHTDNWLTEAFDKQIQAGGDLGQRMSRAFGSALMHHKKVVIIGSDCPEINVDIINTAFEKLDQNDIVIGPAKDGGYYLLGMKSFSPQLFEDITWSSNQVLHQTLDKIEQIGKTVDFCPILSDLDDIKDWEMLKNKFEWL